jgi:hypothetical protein
LANAPKAKKPPLDSFWILLEMAQASGQVSGIRLNAMAYAFVLAGRQARMDDQRLVLESIAADASMRIDWRCDARILLVDASSDGDKPLRYAQALVVALEMHDDVRVKRIEHFLAPLKHADVQMIIRLGQCARLMHHNWWRSQASELDLHDALHDTTGLLPTSDRRDILNAAWKLVRARLRPKSAPKTMDSNPSDAISDDDL